MARRTRGSVESKTLASLRDRAILAVMEQVTVSVDAVIELRVLDYYRLADEHWLRITEEGTQRDILIGGTVPKYLNEYLAAARIRNEPTRPLFRALLRNNRSVSHRAISRRHLIWRSERAKRPPGRRGRGKPAE